MGSHRDYIQAPCQLEDLPGWFSQECKAESNKSARGILQEVAGQLAEYVRWPQRAELLWNGCDRTRDSAQKQRYHTFPQELKSLAKTTGVTLDGRSNGPAIAAYLIAGGGRPNRFSGNNKWSIHHIYNKKFPYPGRKNTLHAVKESKHFTQSAGLVAIHPIADQMCDEYPFFSWLLRAEAYLRFGYDPDGVFSHGQDEYGFEVGKAPTVRYTEV